jgi:glycosyltransferase involved in cell wall biosynthesis
MNVHFFFRKPSEKYHSIELLFKVIQENLPSTIKYKNIYSQYYSTGLIPRKFSAIKAAFQQGQINHITGDIHFFAILMKKQKTILTIHDVEVLKRTQGLKHKIIKLFWFTLPVKRAGAITVISEFTKNELLTCLPNLKNKITIIPNCINKIYTPQPKSFHSEKPVILQVGTKHNKNLEKVAQALENINCQLLVVGELSKKQTELLEYYKIDYTNFGHISLQQMLEMYAKADILLFASTYEGFGLPILEAQAVGRPVITSNMASMPFIAGDSALLINPGKVEEITEAVLQLINNEELRNQLISNGFENIKKYSAQAVAQQYADLYLKLAGQSQSINRNFCIRYLQ